MLTIAIPTYGRNSILHGNLGLLLPQLTPECRLLILDNCSPEPVEASLAALLSQFPDARARIVRNVTNIGANANILRCVELCETPWVWILGDDDPPLPNAIDTLLEAVKSHRECVLINFAIDRARAADFSSKGVEGLAHKLDASADLPWISSSVYRTADFKANLKFGYQYIYSMLPHIAVLLVVLGDRGACYFSRQRILDGEARDIDTPTEQLWSVINLALGYPILFDLPLKLGVRERLAERLTLTNLRPGNGLLNVAFQLLLMSLKQRDHRPALYYFDQICKRQAYRRHPKQKLEAAIYRVMLRFPRVTARVYRLVKGHSLNASQTEDRFQRM